MRRRNFIKNAMVTVPAVVLWKATGRAFSEKFFSSSWFHNCDREHTPAEFHLCPEQKVLFAQSVGYPIEG
ncbi:MAG: hypothetical protein ACPLZD_04310 [Candidatus Saccharicenans sp.]|nr:MAG: hypothetical protein C0168_06005 [Candidatus Aminicenantes bacterium]HEK84808.1 hypothetical protein [Candidatus Aminicenantes bacterium]